MKRKLELLNLLVLFIQPNLIGVEEKVRHTHHEEARGDTVAGVLFIILIVKVAYVGA